MSVFLCCFCASVLSLLASAGFGSIRTIKAETFATRWVNNIWPAVGRSEDTTIYKSKSGKESFQMKPPLGFDKTFKKKVAYKDAVS